MTAEISEILESLRRSFGTGRTRPLAARKYQLERLRAMVVENERDLHTALRADLGKGEFEAYFAETGYTVAAIDHTLKHLAAWMKPEKVSTPLAYQPAKSKIVREPLGVVLIIGPWNYPFQLIAAPLIGALAAGNCAVLKPSEVAPNASKILAQLVPKYLDPGVVRVVEGGVDVTTKLLDQRFDHVFFTGSVPVGRVVMQAAAKHLTPVTLELGGKSPCIVASDADLDVAAKRIVWGKFFNTGQTCIAPDYVLAESSVEMPLLRKMRGALIEFYGTDPKQSADYGRIVNERHHARLTAMLEPEALAGAEVFIGGEHDKSSRYLAPTILRNVTPDAKAMADEIFGPILPVLTVKSIDEAIRFVLDRPKPLSLYLFTESRDTSERVLEGTSSGGVCVNETLQHYGAHDLPFGGVGNSGMGAYHGKTSFETFSHRKAVLDKSTQIDPNLRYPPYTEDKLKWAKRLA